MGLISCGNVAKKNELAQYGNANMGNNDTIIVGANRTDIYIPILKEKRVGVVANQTSVIFKTPSQTNITTQNLDKMSNNDANYTHLVDSLIALGIDIKRVFAPEHGFRGTADAGELIKDSTDIKTGLPLISLYGNNKKPNNAQLKDLDVVVFDIQDVGARFYTYISTLHYIMEACAENNITVLVLDRPNPNGHYVDGPVLEPAHKSFVGMHPVPVVHGMTMGEYAKMINGEHWLKNGIQCNLRVVTLKNYTHSTPYNLPINPSPNLPNAKAINLYPSLCFFEGTNISAGRGTDMQFQIFGSPFLNADVFHFKFTPQPNFGAKHPKYKNTMCFGEDLRQKENLNNISLNWLNSAYQNTSDKTKFFNSFFTKLAGTEQLQLQIESGLSEKDIKATWRPAITAYKNKREKYLLYE